MLEQCIFAGFGGQGTLLIGKILACAALLEGKEVTWMPSYGVEMRGGTANCTVVISDSPVAAPVVDEPDAVIAMNTPSLLKFAPTVAPDGALIVNSSLTNETCDRKDIDVVYVPAVKIAEEIKNPKGANVIMLGAYLALRQHVVLREDLIEAMKEELGPRKMKFLDGNIRALDAGFEHVILQGPTKLQKKRIEETLSLM